MVCSWSLMAQTRTYHGTVVDAANGEPLVGATIQPIGGGQGAAADIDGNFTITVPSGVKKAKVSYVGYNPQTVDLADKMLVKLTSSDTALENLVVVAYGTATKESLTGSVAVVGAKEIEDRPVTSVTAALEGNAPGVQVNNSVGQPGSSPAIRIRGFNSINGTNNPLYVVDGVPFDGTVADLNPADIESMSVLKDAASSALYGNRGANGVVLITTKKAKKVGHVDVTLQVRQGMYNRGLPFYDRLEANEWMQTAFDAYANGLMSSNPNAYPTRESAIEAARQGFVSTYAKANIYGVPDNEVFNEQGKLAGTYLPGYAGDLDWWKAVSRSGYRQEYNVNAAAATDIYNVFASVGYLKENGYMLQTDFERFNARINANFNPVSYFKFGVNLAATSQESEYDDAGGTNQANNPFLTMYTAPIYPYYAHDENGNVIYENGAPVWNVAPYLESNNVAWSMRLDSNNNSANVIDGTLYGTAVIPYGFELTVRGTMHRDKSHSRAYSNNLVGSAVNSGALTTGYADIRSHTFMQTLTWEHMYGDNHVDVLLDHENWNYFQTSAVVNKREQSFPDIPYLSNFESLESASESAGQIRTESYLGRARYNYDQKYFGEVSFRRDGTSRFSKPTRWGNFWSVGGSWVVSREKFMHDVNWVDYLKLRAAYGSVG
ncbi:MAG: SusC/RagA family TonB-linked outer membrane protein, partial [Muribaculaceae bacterium]|nr:SusC/RagA family TonB-linked outer membrane protein [Muribaculaceae bacterium]